MSIYVYFSARRSIPLSEDEARVFEAIRQARNASRPLPNPEEAQLWQLTFAKLKQPWWKRQIRALVPEPDEPKPARWLPALLDARAQLPPTHDYAAARRLLVHWCETFAELRGAVSADGWIASLGGSEMEWNEATRTYALDVTELAWKGTVDLELGTF